MLALDFIEVAAGAALLLFVFFQILEPAGNGKPLFPIFRKKKTLAVHRLTIAEEEVQLAQLDQMESQLKQQAREIRKITLSTPKEEPNGIPKPDAGPPSPDAQ